MVPLLFFHNLIPAGLKFPCSTYVSSDLQASYEYNVAGAHSDPISTMESSTDFLSVGIPGIRLENINEGSLFLVESRGGSYHENSNILLQYLFQMTSCVVIIRYISL